MEGQKPTPQPSSGPSGGAELPRRPGAVSTALAAAASQRRAAAGAAVAPLGAACDGASTAAPNPRLRNRFKFRGDGTYAPAYHAVFAASPWVVCRFRAASGGVGSGAAAEAVFEWTEGDVATVFSQFGEVTDVRMPRGRGGRFGGRAYVCFEDARSCVLAADNLNTPPPAPQPTGIGGAGGGATVASDVVCEFGPLEVDHAEPSEVPPLPPGVFGYREWYEANVLAK